MCLRISGIKESENQDTDKIVLALAQRMKVDSKICDIDRSHRVGVLKLMISVSFVGVEN